MNPEAPSSPVPLQTSSRAHFGHLRDWLMVAWALWWGWAYVQSALCHRFPQLVAWLSWQR
jgi:hypothetical protein